VNIAHVNNDNNIIPNNPYIIMDNINNNINQNNIINNNNVNDLRNQLRNREDWIRMRTYVLTSIDWILFYTQGPNAQYLNIHVDALNNRVNEVNNMIFSNDDQYILYMIMNIVNNSTRNQKKEIYNLFSNLN
jgi:hypothetical protein